MSLSHSERKERRKLMAQRCHELSSQYHKLQDLRAKVAEEFNVTINTVCMACKEFGVVPELEMPPPAEPEIHPKSVRVLDLLKNPELTYRDIAQMVGCTKQNVALIHKKYFIEGYDLPSRAEIHDRRKAQREKVLESKVKACLDLYMENDNLKEAARATGISLALAKEALRDYNAQAKASLYNKAGPVLGRWAHVLADLLKGELTGSQLARKWSLPVPRIFNMVAELRAAGISINLPNGRKLPK